MRIAYLASSHLVSDTANAVHVMRMAGALSRLGHEVTLHARRGDGDTDAEVFDYYGTQPAFVLRRHRDTDNPTTRLLWAARHNIPGLKVGALPDLTFGRLHLRRLLKRERPDLVFARHLPWLQGALPPGTPFLMESHHPPRNGFERRQQQGLFDRPECRGLVVISGPLRDLYLKTFPKLDPARIIVAHDGADPVPDTEVAPQASSDGRVQVGYVGHLYAGRGADIIIAVARRVPQADFHFVGGRAADVEALRAGDLPSNVHLHGHRPPAELAGFYRRFDVVVAPYQKSVSIAGGAGDTSAFMSPLKLFEYMAWGKAILCSDMPVLHEVLTQDETAILLPAADIEAWTQAVLALVADPARRAALGRRARADFLSRFTWDQRARHILDAAMASPPEQC